MAGDGREAGGTRGTRGSLPERQLVAATALHDLLGDFAQRDPADATWICLTELLLQFCRSHPLTSTDWAEFSPWMPEQLEAVALTTLAPGPSTFVDRESLTAAQAWVRSQLDAGDLGLWGPTLVAHALASAIDHVHGEKFVEWFRSRGRHHVRVNTAHPVACYDPRWVLESGAANTRPDRHPERALDAVPHLRLGDRRSGRYNFVIDFDTWFHLLPLSGERPLRIAALQPNLSLAEFALDPPIERFGDDDERPAFRNHGPHDANRQHEILVAQIRHAASLGAAVVVIPEYSLAADQRTRLLTAVEAMDRRPKLLIAGTAERPLDDGADDQVNEAWIVTLDRLQRSWEKVFAAEVAGRHENIVPGEDVTVFWSGSWLIGILICRDGMASELIDQYAELGVNLLLVPSFSQRTTSIVGSSAILATRSQGFSVIVFAPTEWTAAPIERRTKPHDPPRVEAALAGPYAHTARVLEAPGPEAPPPGDGRGIWLFDASARAVEWHDSPERCKLCQ